MPQKIATYYLIPAILVSLLVGFGVAKMIDKDAPLMKENKKSMANPLFNTQAATIFGKVTKAEGDVLTVSNGKETGTFNANANILITKYESADKQGSPSTDLKDIELNKEAIINLGLVGEEYQVISILYSPPPPSPAATKQATSSAR